MSRRVVSSDALSVYADLNARLSKGSIGIYDYGEAIGALLKLQQIEAAKELPKTSIIFDEQGVKIEATHSIQRGSIWGYRIVVVLLSGLLLTSWMLRGIT